MLKGEGIKSSEDLKKIESLSVSSVNIYVSHRQIEVCTTTSIAGCVHIFMLCGIAKRSITGKGRPEPGPMSGCIIALLYALLGATIGSRHVYSQKAPCNSYNYFSRTLFTKL